MKKNLIIKGFVLIILFLFVNIPITQISNSKSLDLNNSCNNFSSQNVNKYENSMICNYEYYDGMVRDKYPLKTPIFKNQNPDSKCVSNGWFSETVDSNGNVGQYSSLALDLDNNPHICYYDETNFDLKYAKKLDDNWYVEIVDSEGDSGFAGTSRSIAIDSFGNPHIVYVQYTYGLKYAVWTGSEWDITVIYENDENERVKFYPSLALDSEDNPHITYIYHKAPYSQNGGGVKYVRWNGTAWEFDDIYESCSSYDATGSMLVIDSNDNPHVVFTHAWYFLKYAYSDEQEWIVETIDNGECWHSNIAVDSNNIPHISYDKYFVIRNAPYWLKYAVRTQEGWESIILDKIDNKHTSITFDNDDYPHISYFSEYSQGGALKHAWWNGTDWIFSVVDYGDYKFTGLYTSTAIDSSEQIHISYYDCGPWELYGKIKYALGSNIIPENNPPETPIISGPTDGEINHNYDYFFESNDPDGDDVYFYVDWGDDSDGYTERFPSGEKTLADHWWGEKGTYIIKVKAVDFLNAESDWAELTVTMPRNRISASTLFMRFLERFPNAFPILRHLLRL